MIGTTPADPDDRGEADEELAAALAGDDVEAALARVLFARLLMPVVALASDDADAEMAVPSLVDGEGATALPAFTSIASLQLWQSDARPVPMIGARLIAGAVAEGYSGVIVDVAGPRPLHLHGTLLTKLGAAAAKLLSGAKSGDAASL